VRRLMLSGVLLTMVMREIVSIAMMTQNYGRDFHKVCRYTYTIRRRKFRGVL